MGCSLVGIHALLRPIRERTRRVNELFTSRRIGEHLVATVGRRVAQAIAVLSVILAFFQSDHVCAHASLVKSDPGRRAVLTASPKRIRLWFNEKIEPAYSSMSVLNADELKVNSAAASVANDNPKLMVLPIEPLGPGTYKVKYRVLSVDGHIVDSSFLFTIKPKVK